MDYYQKYKKYKDKYIKFKLDKFESKEFYESDDSEFGEDFKKNLHLNIMRLEFSHDIGTKKIQGQEMYDLIKNKEVVFNIKGIPVDKKKEDYLKNEFIHFDKSSFKGKFKNINIDKKKTEDINDLSNWNAVFDNLTDNQNLINKLHFIFGISNYYKTFIGNIESFILKSDIATVNIEPKDINNQFITDGKLKKEYIKEAILIGFLPKSLSGLLSFAPYLNFTKITDNFEIHLKYLLEFCNEVKILSKNINFEDIQKKYVNELISLIPKIKKILNEEDKNNKYIMYKDDVRKLVEKLIFSMKEARDGYYIEEINEIKKEKTSNNIIFITTDKIQTFRCILNGISVVNILNGMIRYLAIYNNDNQLKIVGNPFEIFDEKNPIMYTQTSEKIKDIIKDIMSNPIMKVKKNFTYYSKYLVEPTMKINTLSFIENLRSNIHMKFIIKSNTIGCNIIKYLYYNSYGISSYDELIDFIFWYKCNLIDDLDKKDKFSFDSIIHRIEVYRLYMENIKNIKSIKNIKNVDESTYRFFFLFFFGYLTSFDENMYLFCYLLYKYFKVDFNYKQIFTIWSNNQLSYYKVAPDNIEYNNILKLIKEGTFSKK